MTQVKMTKSQIELEYTRACTALGDIRVKIMTLEAQESKVLAQVKMLAAAFEQAPEQEELKESK